MPRSKKRKHHHDFHPPTHTDKPKKNKSAVAVGVIFFALLGLGIAYFATGTNVLWLLAGVVLGAAAGYFFGQQIDKAFSKK